MFLSPASHFLLLPIWLVCPQLFCSMRCCFLGIIYGIWNRQLTKLSQLGFFSEMLGGKKGYPVIRHTKPVWEEDEWIPFSSFSYRASSFVWLNCLERYSNTPPVVFSPFFIYLNVLSLDLCHLQQTALMNILTGSHLLCVQKKNYDIADQFFYIKTTLIQ